MDRKLRYTFLFVLMSFVAYGQQTTQQKLKHIKVDHFFTCTLDQFMDTLAAAYDIPIVYERDSLMQMDITEHFFDEPLGKVIKFACKENNLQYWIENDGTLYILQQPDDLPRLKRQYELNQTARNFKPVILAPPAHLPTHFRYTLSGRVTDQRNGEALPGASVKIRGTDLNTLTNTSGNFSILGVPSDTAAVEISFTGYQPDVFRLDSTSVTGNVSYALFPSLNVLSQVVVIGKKKGVMNTDSKKVSVIQLTPALLDKLPNIGEKDIMRSFQLMPGVAATNESSSGIYVRGGTPDQNLVTLDGFTIYQVDHLYGFFSAFNANAIRDVELYKGGYTAKYGGRLSSVTEVRGKDGNRKEVNIGGDISLLSTNIYAETPIGTKASALVAFRRSYQGPLYSKIFGQFNTSVATGAPGGGGGGGGMGGPGGGGGGGGFNNQVTPSSYFYDLNTKFTYAPSAKNNFSWSLYKGTDQLDNSREMTLPSFVTSSGGTLNITDNTHYGNLGTSVKWNTSPSQKLFGSTVLSYSSFFSDRNRGTTGTITDTATTININTGVLENNKLRDAGIKSDWEWNAASKLKVLFGGFNSNVKIDYTYTQNDTTQLINQHNSGSTTGAYTEIEYEPNSKWHLQPGFRSTYFSPTGKFYYEPRLSAIYHLTDNINLKGATGRFYQFTNRVIREDVSGGDRNFWVLANSSNIPVGVSDHFILGTSYETGKYLFDVEGYYKKLNGLTEYSIRQSGGAGGGGGGIGGGGFGSPMGGGGGGATTTTISENFYNGSGFAKGIEFLLQKKTGIYTGWISYTLAEAKNKFDVYGTDYFSAAQDIRHEFKSVNMYHLQRWSFAATFIFSTGHPYTAPAGVYNVTTLDGNKISYLSVSQKNGERLPAYHRMDISATYDLLKTDATKIGSISFSLFNVYNHRNTWYNEYYIRGNQVVTTTVKYLGLTPNITLSLKLK